MFKVTFCPNMLTEIHVLKISVRGLGELIL